MAHRAQLDNRPQHSPALRRHDSRPVVAGRPVPHIPHPEKCPPGKFEFQISNFKPPGEVGPGQDGLSGPWANFEGAKMACLGRGKVGGGQLPPWGRGVVKSDFFSPFPDLLLSNSHLPLRGPHVSARNVVLRRLAPIPPLPPWESCPQREVCPLSPFHSPNMLSHDKPSWPPRSWPMA